MRRGGRYYACDGKTSTEPPAKKKPVRKKSPTESETTSGAITTPEQTEVTDDAISR